MKLSMNLHIMHIQYYARISNLEAIAFQLVSVVNSDASVKFKC